MVESHPIILIIDDEAAIRRYLRTVLASENYDTVEAVNGREGMLALSLRKPDVVILDLGLPDMDGVEVARQIRQWNETPIIILSVRENEKDKVAALDAGADDYLTKPFGTNEFLARLRAALRRANRSNISQPVYQIDTLQVDLDRRLVTQDTVEVSLTPTEYDLLATLIRNAGKVLTHKYLLEKVWGIEYTQETHLLRVNISNLRRKIEKDPARPAYLLTEPGVGYRLRMQV
jgi:two-component system, OmpR family, KDP operon response regulator KdpE